MKYRIQVGDVRTKKDGQQIIPDREFSESQSKVSTGINSSAGIVEGFDEGASVLRVTVANV